MPRACVSYQVHDTRRYSRKLTSLALVRAVFEAADGIGLDATGPRHLAPKLQQAGFVDINVKTYKWPLGQWAKGARFKLLGHYVFEDQWDALPSLSLGLFTRVLNWSRDEVEVFLASCRHESKRTNRHYYGECLIWYARKPLDVSSLPPGNSMCKKRSYWS